MRVPELYGFNGRELYMYGLLTTHKAASGLTMRVTRTCPLEYQ